MDGQIPGSTRKGRNKNRDSVADETILFSRHLEDTLSSLRDIWDKVGLRDDLRGERVGQFYRHLKSLLSEMLAEEQEMAKEISTKIDKFGKELHKLCRELGLPDFVPEESLTMVEMEAELREQVDALSKEKHRRLKTLQELRSEDKHLAERLFAEPFFLPASSVPTQTQLDALQEHTEQLRQILADRVTLFQDSKRHILTLMRKLNLTPTSDFEKAVVKDDEHSFPLSTANLSAMNVLLTQLETKYAEHLATIRTRIHEIKNELQDWWEKCHVCQEDRNALPMIDEESYSEEALDLYRKEVLKWRSYYAAREAVLATVNAWMELWQEKVEHERKQNDPARYNNRGGNLEKELKRARHVDTVLLPKAYEDISTAVQQWNDNHPGESVRVNGMLPLAYIEAVQLEYGEEKEKEKQEKQLAKKRQLENETRYGTTPAKLRPQPSPKRTAGTTLATQSPKRQLQHTQKINDTRNSVRHHPYTHSSVKALRSPAAKPPGLPVPPSASSSSKTPKSDRRKPMADMQTPKPRDDAQRPPLTARGATPIATPSNATASSIETYKEFAVDIHGRGLEVQSSFLSIQHSPGKNAPY